MYINCLLALFGVSVLVKFVKERPVLNGGCVSVWARPKLVFM